MEVDLRNNIAAEARAKITYERLLDFCEDPGSKDALMFLMTREIAHMKSFVLAIESLGKDELEIGQIPPDPKFVNKYFNDSTGYGTSGRDRCPRPVEHRWF
jgi:Mn-containing catalase